MGADSCDRGCDPCPGVDACMAEGYAGAVVTSCPECGQVTDIDYPECRANVHENVTFTPRESCGDHANPSPDVADCAVPLAEQEARYERYWMREVLRLERDLKRPTYLQHIHDLGLERLREGFRLYGSTMYGWTDAEAQANEDEEVTDRIVYGTAHG
jgi:hypothetical protein